MGLLAVSSRRRPLRAVVAVSLLASASACAAPVERELETVGSAMKEGDAEDMAACLGAPATSVDARQVFRRRAAEQVVYVDLGPLTAAELAVPPGESVAIAPVGMPNKTRSLASAPQKGPLTLANDGTRTVRYRVTFAPNERWTGSAGFVHVTCRTLRYGTGRSDGSEEVCLAGEPCTTMAGVPSTCQARGIDASEPDADGVAIGLCL